MCTKHWWNDMVKVKYAKENPLQCHSVHKKFHAKQPGITPELLQ
jgi:hypothetical protein